MKRIGGWRFPPRSPINLPSHRPAIPMSTLTICPPAAAHDVLPSEPQFINSFRNRAVAVQFEAHGEVTSNGLDYGDYSRCQTMRVGGATYRRKPTPEYALNPDALRRLLVRFLER